MNKIIKINGYEIHSYPALIKISCDDGSVIYDSRYGFTSESDFMESWSAWENLISSGQSFMQESRKPISLEKIYGIDEVKTALENVKGCQA